MSWLIEHLTGALGGGVLGILGHLGTQAIGWFRDRQNIGAAEPLAGLKARDDVQKASYAAVKDWIHPAVAVLLLGLYVTAAWTGAPDDLVSSLATWCGVGFGWLFGRLALK